MIVGRRALLSAAAGAALVAAAPGRADAAPPAWKTMQGPFTQERTLGLFKSKVLSRGSLTLVRPDRLRWELFAPDAIVYWATPDVLAYQSKEGVGVVPASSGRLAASMADLRALLMGGDLTLLRPRYDLRESPREGGGTTIEATPKDVAKAPFRKLTLELGQDGVRPVRATMLEGPKDQTTIAFGDLLLDAPVDPKQMAPPRS